MCGEFVCAYLLGMVAHRQAQFAGFAAQHLARHERVEKASYRKRKAEVKSKHPPVLCMAVKLGIQTVEQYVQETLYIFMVFESVRAGVSDLLSTCKNPGSL